MRVDCPIKANTLREIINYFKKLCYYFTKMAKFTLVWSLPIYGEGYNLLHLQIQVSEAGIPVIALVTANLRGRGSANLLHIDDYQRVFRLSIDDWREFLRYTHKLNAKLYSFTILGPLKHKVIASTLFSLLEEFPISMSDLNYRKLEIVTKSGTLYVAITDTLRAAEYGHEMRESGMMTLAQWYDTIAMWKLVDEKLKWHFPANLGIVRIFIYFLFIYLKLHNFDLACKIIKNINKNLLDTEEAGMYTTIIREDKLKSVENHEFDYGKRVWYRYVIENRENESAVNLEMIRINGYSYISLSIPRDRGINFYLTPSLLLMENNLNAEVNDCLLKSENWFRGEYGSEGECRYERIIKNQPTDAIANSNYYALRVRVVFARRDFYNENIRAKVKLAILLRKTADDEFKPSCQLIRFSQVQFGGVLCEIQNLIDRVRIKELEQSNSITYF